MTLNNYKNESCSYWNTLTVSPITTSTTTQQIENAIKNGVAQKILESPKEFFKKYKEKYDVDYTDEYVYLYLKTESELKSSSTIIDSNGEITLNIQNEPKDMYYVWTENKERSFLCGDCSIVSSIQSENKLETYRKILGTLSGDKYNYYKVKVQFADIKDINESSLKVNVTKMEIIEKIDSTPKITFKITDIKENGDLMITLINSLTHSNSPEFRITAKSKEEIVPAIEKKLEKMYITVDLSKNKGEIDTKDLSSELQKYINKGE